MNKVQVSPTLVNIPMKPEISFIEKDNVICEIISAYLDKFTKFLRSKSS